jgi:hypothetical protein
MATAEAIKPLHEAADLWCVMPARAAASRAVSHAVRHNVSGSSLCRAAAWHSPQRRPAQAASCRPRPT